MNIKWGKIGLFAGGMLASTCGVRMLTSKPAKKVYTWVTALGLRGRDEVMTTVTSVREACDDIYADAQEYNKELDEKSTAAEVIE